MKRRDFLSGKFEQYSGDRLLSLEKETAPLDRKKAYHLLRRITFAPTPEMLDIAIGKTPDEVVDSFLNPDAPLPSGDELSNWKDTQEEDPLSGLPQEIRSEIEGRLRSRYRDFKDWWLDLMRNENATLMEKLTLFWTNVWCIEFTYDTLSLVPPPLIYRNNQTLRQHRLGNYKKIVEEMTLDGAMLLYQSLNFSTKEAPNENFIRELLELFTMGIGHYSEGDIREGARVLTGWRTAAYLYQPKPNGAFETYFLPNAHDTGSKTFMGVSIKGRNEADNSEFQVREEEVKGLINILFTERPYEIARFVSEKIYTYFLYSSPGDVELSIIEDMAETMVQNDFEIYPVVKEFLTSKHFYEDTFIGGQFKTPPAFIVGLERMLNTEYKTGTVKRTRMAVDDLEQELYDPPNVSGWKGYRSWISTKTYPARIDYANTILDGTEDSNLIELIRKFPEYTDIESAIDYVLEYLLPREVSLNRRENYKSTLLNGLNANQWANEIDTNSQTIINGMRNLLKEIFKAPDFQLC